MPGAVGGICLGDSGILENVCLEDAVGTIFRDAAVKKGGLVIIFKKVGKSKSQLWQSETILKRAEL